MSSKNIDDFWNSSSTSGFNFDEDEEELPQPDYEFQPAPKDTTIAIHSLISKKSLDLILDDIKSAHEYTVPPVEEVIRKMASGHKYSLDVYKKFSDKLLLFNSALESMDGNIILKVILFLESTLNRSIFVNQLIKSKTGIKHYANYLIVNHRYDDLTSFYISTGVYSNMKQLYYLMARGTKSKSIILGHLNSLGMDSLQKMYNKDDSAEYNPYIQLLRWQIEKNENCESVIEQLAVLCKKEWDVNKNAVEVIFEFKKRLKIDDFAFEWTVMNVLASKGMWPQLNDFFMKPNWLTKKHSLKTVIPTELFVYGLSKHNPPKDVLEQYLPYINNTERSLLLAQKLNCHKFVIQHYINQRDRVGLINYKASLIANKLTPQNPEYFMIENALQSTDKKWKN
ncbi:spermatogenesis-defective protein 39 homolog isoform X3 [Diabrotica virgifera virgifera]|uniref:Spermatogenesis-defective protein 39 homolog n=1 Tax=Diabrotica virgifera virgifera TaxID=50390 RepID=A0A6P7GKY6_DIAVI|nr:spermatogenesis-defective protein 39 homolog isoform X3 [Diabrotica virgifera virgifera]